MVSFSWNNRIVVALLAAVSLVARADICNEIPKDQISKALIQEVKASSQRRLGIFYGTGFKSKMVSVHDLRSYKLVRFLGLHDAYKNSIEVNYGLRKVGWFGLTWSESVLVYDIALSERYRNQGLRVYQEWLEAALHILPKIRYLPARMKEEFSENTALFFSNFLRDGMKLPHDNINEWSKLTLEQRKALRRLILESYQSMPAAKVRNKLGFKKVDFLRVGLSARNKLRQISFLAEKAEANSPEDTLVILEFIKKGSVSDLWELTVDGTIEPYGQDAFDLKYPAWREYDKMHPW